MSVPCRPTWTAFSCAGSTYRHIAEYYAQATPQMQRLMERSALVIIDMDDAIANGFVKLQGEML